MTLDDCEQIFDRSLSSTSESEFIQVIEPLWDHYEVLSLEFGRGNIFWRARLIKNDIYSYVSDLHHPPPGSAKQGRINNTGEPCLYVSARKETALVEIGATEGQRAQLAGFRVKNETPIRLAVIGEYANIQKNGYMHFAGRDPDMAIARLINSLPRERALSQIYIDKFLADILADRDASKNGYMFSRAFAEVLYAKSGANGIVFPSVKDRDGFNVAVKEEPSNHCFHNVSCLVVQMGKPRRFGMTEFSVLRSAERLDDSGRFVWPENREPETIGIYNMSKEEFEAASCSTDDRNKLLDMLHLHAKR